MYFHLILTDSCNLCCKYCRGKIFETPEPERETITIDESVPSEITWKFEELYRFLQKDPDAVLTFIGGEPTLRPDLICRIMEEAPVRRFMIQTNGLLLHRLPPDIVNRFETILISIDGDRSLTDAMRGKGVYNRVMENIHHILAGGFQNELIARMTVTEQTDIHQAVTHLAWNTDYPFSSIHWQMDANFWNDYPMRRFHNWATESYIPGIEQLVTDWIEIIRRTGTVPRWYPFIDPVEDLIYNRTTRLRCGSGYTNFSIQTDGVIIPCPIMIGMKDYYAGTLTDSEPADLTQYSVEGRCRSCDILDFCGGRCLYSSIMQPWPPEGAEIVCATVRALYKTLTSVLPEMNELLQKGIISSDKLAHEKFNGCEVIP